MFQCQNNFSMEPYLEEYSNKQYNRAPDKRGTEDNSKVLFLISHKNKCCDPSSEPSQRDGSHDGSQNMFL